MTSVRPLLSEVIGNPSSLRVLREDPQTAIGVDIAVVLDQTNLVDLDRAKAVAVPISGFWNYAVAIENDR